MEIMENINYKILFIVIVIVLIVYTIFFSESNKLENKLEHITNLEKKRSECDKDCSQICVEKCKKCITTKCKGKRGNDKNECIKNKCDNNCLGNYRDKCYKDCDKSCKQKIKNEKNKKTHKKKSSKQKTTKKQVKNNVNEDVAIIKDIEEIEAPEESSVMAPSNNFDELLANKADIGNVKFTKNWTAYPDDKTDGAEISNDTDLYKQLMIIGNKSAGGIRQVGVWDQLNVNGTLKTVGQFCLGDTCIDEEQLKKMIK